MNLEKKEYLLQRILFQKENENSFVTFKKNFFENY